MKEFALLETKCDCTRLIEVDVGAKVWIIPVLKDTPHITGDFDSSTELRSEKRVFEFTGRYRAQMRVFKEVMK